jgi:hypothetical protein
VRRGTTGPSFPLPPVSQEVRDVWHGVTQVSARHVRFTRPATHAARRLRAVGGGLNRHANPPANPRALDWRITLFFFVYSHLALPERAGRLVFALQVRPLFRRAE